MKFSLKRIMKAITVEPYEIKDEKGKTDRDKSRQIAGYAMLAQY
ncbi:hypothetical protein [Methanobrevibacter sp.]